MARNPEVAIIDPDLEARADLARILAGSQVTVVGEGDYGIEAVTVAKEHPPDIFLISMEEPVARALQTIESMSELLPDSPIIAYSSQTDSESARKAVVAGARDYLTKPLKMNEVVKAVQAALSQHERRRALLAGDSDTSPKSAGMIITIFGAKGGIGKTTTAINLASAFVAINAGSAVVVDMDTVFGDVAMMMDVPVEGSLVDAADKVDELDRESIGSYLGRHSSGVRVLPAPFEPTDWRNVSPDAVEKVLALLSHTHDFVILDCPATFTDLVAVALDKATVVLLLTSLDITSIKDTTTALKLLSNGMNNEEKIKLVINRPTNVNSVGEDDVSKVLRREVVWSVPHDAEISASLQLGTPVVIDRPLSAVSETIREMAAMLAGVEVTHGGNGRDPGPAETGILSRLFKRE